MKEKWPNPEKQKIWGFDIGFWFFPSVPSVISVAKEIL
jgi:hypothetical protein